MQINKKPFRIPPRRILVVLGTRPEGIKLAPVILRLKSAPAVFAPRVCVTAQHRLMLDQTLALFGIKPDIDLDLMRPGRSLTDLIARLTRGVGRVLADERPDLVLVQGDTTTTMAAALAAFHERIPIGHVEAGLRTGDPAAPFPEEINRRIVGLVSRFHFAPTERARRALLKEGVPASFVHVTGNTGIDALKLVARRPRPRAADTLIRRAGQGRGRRIILVTAHRREHFGGGLEAICLAVRTLAAERPDTTIVFPVHLNPKVRRPVRKILGGSERILLTDPLPYDVMIHLMKASRLILTDSGGIQEEAPSLGVPVLVLRSRTERPEAVAAGRARLVDADPRRIAAEAGRILDDARLYRTMAVREDLFGDGRAAGRIAAILARDLNPSRPS